MNRGKKKQTGWTPLGKVLATALSMETLNQTEPVEWCIFQWPQVVGPEIAKISHVSALSGATLKIVLVEPEWLAPLKALETRLVEDMNLKAGKEFLNHIRFKVETRHAALCAEPERKTAKQ
ncbi:MAG: DUF721 domain-containing protein [Candidatus Nitrohelix vancouverensis]|uniref:DUF721 domain-containing protein n=1 Tax=Candidatus Nitrohelix vancouverensis TaxID=2705534 RepID=A0A7T0C0W4_9BACT|nr:MAG: DUF721 domain-containing protein [Candidatus Nitrohelix vancouverensis]